MVDWAYDEVEKQSASRWRGRGQYGGVLMRRLSILLVFALMFALLVLAPSTAVPPDCDAEPSHPSCKSDDTKPPRPPPFEECVFINGVLKGWEPPESYHCQWTVTDRFQQFNFTLKAVTPDGKTVNLPYLIVTDVFPYGGDVCFNVYVVGWSKLPYSWRSVTLPADGECSNPDGGVVDTDGEDTFAITIDVIKVKKGTVELTYTTE
jgi:hypothetical protein